MLAGLTAGATESVDADMKTDVVYSGEVRYHLMAPLRGELPLSRCGAEKIQKFYEKMGRKSYVTQEHGTYLVYATGRNGRWL